MKCHEVLVLVVLLAATSTSFARKGYGPGEQDWGYVDVREGAHMFYWLYNTTAADGTQRPLVIWLGSPISASTGAGNFETVGTIDLNGNERNSSWVKNMNVLFIDGPVGSGFSYVDAEKYLARNSSKIALDLVKCMQVFFARHKQFEEVPLHIFTENYGGKIAPEFALELYYANQRNEIKCKLVSIAMGNPFTSPIDSMLAWAPFLFYTGIVDQNGYNDIMISVNKTAGFVDNKQWLAATAEWGQTQLIIKKKTKNVNINNILTPVKIDINETRLPDSNNTQVFPSARRLNFVDHQQLVLENLMRGPVSKALGIPSHVKWGSQHKLTYKNIREDVMKPAVHFVSEILKNTNLSVGVYSGQLDLSCTTAGTLSWIEKLEWNSRSEYVNARHQPINVNGYVEGYEKSGGKFSMFWVERAGRFVPLENPAAMSHILKRFTSFG